MEKIDSLGVDHDVQLTNVKETISKENVKLKNLRDEKEKALEFQQSKDVSLLVQFVTIGYFWQSIPLPNSSLGSF